jgi:prepilin-type N-terminal cleavage/methylation domain-containing protein
MSVRERCRGVSLVEILVVLGIIAVAALIALPNLQQAQVRNRLNSPVRDLERLASVARFQAINRGSQAVMALLSDAVSDEFAGQSFSQKNGAVIFLDLDNSGTWSSTEPMAGRYTVSRPVSYKRPGGGDAIDAPGDRVVFVATGAIAGSGDRTLYLGDEHGNHVRLVFNGVTGQVRREMNVPGTSQWLGVGREQDWRWIY